MEIPAIVNESELTGNWMWLLWQENTNMAANWVNYEKYKDKCSYGNYGNNNEFFYLFIILSWEFS